MIDPKELRIGAHVEYKGERLIVCAISGTDISLIKSSTPIGIYKDVWCAYVEPIPITEKLLTELGFEKRESGSFAKEYAPGSWIFLTPYATEELCKVNIFPSDPIKEASSVLGCYLHELEQFLYLTTKTELIKE